MMHLDSVQHLGVCENRLIKAFQYVMLVRPGCTQFRVGLRFRCRFGALHPKALNRVDLRFGFRFRGPRPESPKPCFKGWMPGDYQEHREGQDPCVGSNIGDTTTRAGHLH